MFIPVGTDSPIYYWPYTTGILIVVNIIGFGIQNTVQNSGPDEFALNDQRVGVARTLTIQDLDLQLNQDRPGGDGPPQFNFEAEEPLDEDELVFDFEEEFEDAYNEAIREELSQGWHGYALWHGMGIHPIQWLTSAFMHAGIGHLIGNMIFLGIFGWVVETRLGNIGFAIYYLVTAVLQNALLQVVMLGADEPSVSLGASTAIYGVMAAASLWFPKDNIICLFWIWFYVFFPKVPVLMFGAIYVIWDFTGMVFTNELMNTPFLHVTGAFVGGVAAIFILRKGWVDTEYGDVISLFIEATGRDPEKVNPRKKTQWEIREEEERKQHDQFEREKKLHSIWNTIDAHLDSGNTDAAMLMERQARRISPSSTWDESRLLKLIGKLQTQEKWENVIFYSQLYLKKFQSKQNTIRINMAKIMLVKKQAPRQTIKILAELNDQPLTDSQSKMVKQMVAKSRKMIDDGFLEVGEF